MRRSLLLTTFAVCCFALELHAAVWGDRGISRRFLAEGTRLYVADGRGVALYDVADPAAPVRVDVEIGDGESNDLAMFGSGNMVVATSAGIDRFTVAADGTLTRAGSLPIRDGVQRVAAGTAWAAGSSGRSVTIFQLEGDQLREGAAVSFEHKVADLAFVGGWLYASVEGEGFYIVEPASGAVVATVAHLVDDFALSGETLWTASTGRGLAKFDVHDPLAPLLRWETREVLPHAVAVSGNLVAAIRRPDSVAVFDASGTPVLAASIKEPASVVALSGGHLFLAGGTLDPEGLPIENGRALRAFDVGDPARPRFEGEYVDLAGPVSGVWTDGAIAIAVDRPWLRVLDVSKTSEPRQIAAIIVPGIQDRIRVKDGIAVIYGRTFVNIVDVSRPADPRYLGSWYTQGNPVSTATLANGRMLEANRGSGLHLVDFSDPEHAVQVGGRIWHYWDLTAGDDVIYAMQWSNFLVLQLDGTKVIDRAFHDMEGKQLEIAPALARIPRYLVGLEYKGLRVWDLADRFAPVQSGFVPTTEADLLGTGDDVAWVVVRGELQRLDLTDPRSLQPSGMRVSAPMQISVAGDKIAIADRYFVRVYGPDTVSPLAPRRRGVRH